MRPPTFALLLLAACEPAGLPSVDFERMIEQPKVQPYEAA